MTARAHLAAARAVLDASPLLARQALVHLVRARDQLTALPGADRLRGFADEIATAEADPAAPLPPRRRLRAHLARLERLERDRVLAAGYPDRRLRTAARHWRLLVAGCFAIVLAVLAVAATWPTARPWRVSYFAGDGLTGQPVTRSQRQVDIDWGRGRPVGSIGADWFSVRFESCLVVDRATDAAFMLISEDSSILYVDGEPAVDNRGQHRTRARGAVVPLAPGRHLLRVDYQHQTGSASIALLASLDGAAPRAIPTGQLRPPDDCVSRP